MALEDLVIELGNLGKWVQAVGLLVVLWIIVQAITMFFNRKRRLLLIDISERLKRVENKVDNLAKNKSFG